MIQQKYIGIENELKTFRGNSSEDAGKFFKSFIDNSDYKKTGSSIRTATGHGYYVDGSELEILTPPVVINKGFSTRLTDLLMMGRDRVVEYDKKLKHTGYSMHWNVTDNLHVTDSRFFQGIAVPFHLFGLTPLSTGLNVRSKTGTGRYEILGDSLSNEEQINATALLLGAYCYAIEMDKGSPISPMESDSEMLFKCRTNLFLPNGRFNEINVTIHDAQFRGEIQAQQYLELFYHWIKPFVYSLGTKEERKNLEDFIFARKNLEFDNFKYFTHIKDQDGKEGGIYLPIKNSDGNHRGQVLESTGKQRELPLEGLLLGEIVKQKRENINEITWEAIEIIEINVTEGIHIPNREIIRGIDKIYAYAGLLNPNLPKIKKSYCPETKKPNKLASVEKREKIEYNPKQDIFYFKNKEVGWRDYIPNLRDIKFKKFVITTLLNYILLSGGAYLASRLANEINIDHQTKQTIEEYHNRESTQSGEIQNE